MMQISYKALTSTQQRNVAKRLVLRKKIYLSLLATQSISPDIIIVGDRPGPAAPTEPNYHHTPFYSTKYCSGWLNAGLELHEIPENRLAWVNAYSCSGEPLDYNLVDRLYPRWIFALGNNALKWIAGRSNQVMKFDHPQYHKRFKNKEEYPLFDYLKEYLKS
jgi:hypothetical protein